MYIKNIRLLVVGVIWLATIAQGMNDKVAHDIQSSYEQLEEVARSYDIRTWDEKGLVMPLWDIWLALNNGMHTLCANITSAKAEDRQQFLAKHQHILGVPRSAQVVKSWETLVTTILAKISKKNHPELTEKEYLAGLLTYAANSCATVMISQSRYQSDTVVQALLAYGAQSTYSKYSISYGDEYSIKKERVLLIKKDKRK